MNKITSWSYSRWKTYTECPLRAKLKFIDKLPDPSGPAADRGSAIHKMAQDYVEGFIPELPLPLNQFSMGFDHLRRIKAKCEIEWAFTASWTPTDWLATDAWLRVKTDAYVLKDDELTIIDYKTGRVYPEHKDQCSIYALAGFLVVPGVKEICTQLWYTDQQQIADHLYKKKDFPALKKDWIKRSRPMLNDTKFLPIPGAHCRYCIFKKGVGGQCPC